MAIVVDRLVDMVVVAAVDVVVAVVVVGLIDVRDEVMQFALASRLLD